ncbi:class I SAM-dependent methyltransferase [Ensifer adhaerens]|uniref:class I SAM-dependent methyltransferase n=1 Tax=Ensifer adhaerens TaxID=106592 RepID=UPI00069DDFD4|nr:class I SAM-dependent methyltransferase [Ensifer adhaerens]
MRRPRFIAEQARNATGLVGRLIAFIMSHETKGDNRRAIDALDVKPTDHVLDIGCGHGRSLPELATLASTGKVSGADPSDLMAAIAIRHCGQLIPSGRVQVVIAGVDALPFPDAAFDKALCVHAVYFWPDLSRSFGEIARVLKPGGRLALLFRTNANQAVNAFPSDVYHFPALDEMRNALEAVGFAVDVPADAAIAQKTAPVLLIASMIENTKSKLT